MDADVIRRLRHLHEWVAPSHGLQADSVDAHCAGQALRLIVGGVPECPGRTMIERQGHASAHLLHILRALVLEPRGHPDLVAGLLTRPQRSDSHCGALFMHRGGFCSMSAHGIVAVTTILLESGLAEMRAPETRLKIDTPAGMVRSYGKIADDRVAQVFFENVPSFAVAEDFLVDVPGIGRVTCDIGYGGAFFAYVEAAALRLECTPERSAELSRIGTLILDAVNRTREFVHPLEPGIRGLHGVVFVDQPRRRRGNPAQSRHVCVQAGGAIDRSPCGMAISARLAIHAAHGQMHTGDSLTVEGLAGLPMSGRLVAEGEEGGRRVVIAEIEGRAWITGRHTFLIAPDDPLREGFLL